MSRYLEPGEKFIFRMQKEKDDSQTFSLCVDREIYRGGSKQTIVVRDIRSGTFYFMKILFFAPEERIYVEKESKVQLYSPFLMRVYGGMADYENGRFLTMMEYIDAPDLSTVVRERRIAGDSPAERSRVRHRIAMKFLYGIRHYMNLYADDPIIHRDLKPENVIASTDGSVVKIIDFDWVHLHHSDLTVSRRQEQKGTLGYVDPRYWNSYICTRQMDIYSAGLVLYFLYTGKHHFYGNEEIERYMTGDDYAYCLKEMRGESAVVAPILQKMIAPEEERYENIDAVIHDMESCLTKQGEYPYIPEIFGREAEGSTIRLIYQVGNIRYSLHLKDYHFVPIDFGRRQKRSRNGENSGHILSFYRVGESIRVMILSSDCQVVSCENPEDLKEGDTFFYDGVPICIVRIIRERD